MNPESAQPSSDSPQPPPQLHQAVTSQGILLGQHDQVLRGLAESNQILLSQMSMLVDRVAELAARNPQQPPTPASAVSSESTFASSSAGASQGPPITREPFVPTPERYGGDLGTCQAFLMQVSLVFELQPATYSTDRSRIAYVLSLLTGSARDWGSAVWEAQSPLCHSYPAFSQEMKKVFDHPIRGHEAGRRLFTLRQGSRSTAEYAVEFRTLAAGSGWNDLALQGAFRRGLCEGVKDELATRDEAASLDALISLAIRVDNRLRERRRERGARPPQPAPVRHPHPGSHSTFSPGPQTLAPTEVEPMQLGRARLTEEEKQRRRQTNACLYCGEGGHYAASCPAKRGKDRAPQ